VFLIFIILANLILLLRLLPSHSMVSATLYNKFHAKMD
jgi:hypothetical protein